MGRRSLRPSSHVTLSRAKAPSAKREEEGWYTGPVGGMAGPSGPASAAISMVSCGSRRRGVELLPVVMLRRTARHAPRLQHRAEAEGARVALARVVARIEEGANDLEVGPPLNLAGAPHLTD